MLRRFWRWLFIPLDEKGFPMDERFTHSPGKVSWLRRIEYALGTGSDYYFRHAYQRGTPKPQPGDPIRWPSKDHMRKLERGAQSRPGHLDQGPRSGRS